jgi:hypothetical protein
MSDETPLQSFARTIIGLPHKNSGESTMTVARSSASSQADMPRRAICALFAGAALVSLVGAGAAMGEAKAATPAGEGTAVYWMTADTASGMGAMSAGGQTNGGAMARMMLGGGTPPSYARTLQLQLGASRKAAGEPTAEHLPPQALGAGPSLPLVTPKSAPASTGPYDWKNMEKPKGRMLIYWGCGDHVRANQPVVIDYASLMSGKAPPAFATMNMLTPPHAGAHATYGEWPNARSQAHVPPSGSLVGEHVVRGNYTPELKFSVAAANDFLAPVQIGGNQANGIGAIPLTWRPIAGAKAWLVSTVGSAENGDMIMWSSSETQAMAMAAAHMSPGEIDRLIKAKVLLPATATSCTVPAEVVKAAPSSMLMTTALGGQGNYAEPKPAGAPASWKPDWTVKLLAKSTYTGMLGMDMSEMFGGGASNRGYAEGDEAQEAPTTPQPKKKKKSPLGGALGGLGGLIGN